MILHVEGNGLTGRDVFLQVEGDQSAACYFVHNKIAHHDTKLVLLGRTNCKEKATLSSGFSSIGLFGLVKIRTVVFDFSRFAQGLSGRVVHHSLAGLHLQHPALVGKGRSLAGNGIHVFHTHYVHTACLFQGLRNHFAFIGRVEDGAYYLGVEAQGTV